MRLYENSGDIDVPMTGRDKKPILHELVDPSLNSAMLSFIQLANSGMHKMPDCKY